MNIMLDLETMGIEPGCAIVAIGAVKFDTAHGMYDRPFYSNVSLKSCTDKGLTIDPSTVMWWLKQSEEARTALLSNTHELKKVLTEFAMWAEQDADSDAPSRSIDPWTSLWCCGTDFDIPILKVAFRVCNKHWPFDFGGYRDVRTMRNLDIEAAGIDRNGLHNALEDAKFQAAQVIAVARALGVQL